MAHDEVEAPVSAAGLADDERKERKRRRKEAKLQAQYTRSMDPWERYRALVDTLKEAQDLVELADRKARFALVIMGALNVAFFFVATRSGLADYVPPWLRPFLGFYLLVYAAVALFFFLEAIEALRPRRYRPHVPYPGEGGPEHFPERLRYYEDITQRDLEDYRRAWREVRFGHLNAELAVQNHIMAHINSAKYHALRRLYVGLRVLTILAGGLLVIVTFSMLSRRPPGRTSSAGGDFVAANATEVGPASGAVGIPEEGQSPRPLRRKRQETQSGFWTTDAGETGFEESAIQVREDGGFPVALRESVSSLESPFPQALEGLEVGLEELIKGSGSGIPGPVSEGTQSGAGSQRTKRR